MAIYVSRKNKLGDSLDVDATLIYKQMLKARLKTGLIFFVLSNNVVEFKNIWCPQQFLCSVQNEQNSELSMISV